MVKEIMHDPVFLARKAEPAGEEDIQTALDLLDTLAAHKEECVGMAANMIGVNRAVIVFDNEGEAMAMLNPKLLKADGKFRTEEGCLSLSGRRETVRYKSIKVEYQDLQLRKRIHTYRDWTAQIIQHEMDHLNGILI